MKEYQKPFLEDEDILIEDIMNGSSLTVQDTRGPNINDDPGEEFLS